MKEAKVLVYAEEVVSQGEDCWKESMSKKKGTKRGDILTGARNEGTHRKTKYTQPRVGVVDVDQEGCVSEREGESNVRMAGHL